MEGVNIVLTVILIIAAGLMFLLGYSIGYLNGVAESITVVTHTSVKEKEVTNDNR